MDLKAAYDSLPYHSLFAKIRVKGFSVCSTIAVINGELTEPIPIQKAFSKDPIYSIYFLTIWPMH